MDRHAFSHDGARKLVRKLSYRHETRAVLATSTVAAASEMSKANTSNISYGYVDGLVPVFTLVEAVKNLLGQM